MALLRIVCAWLVLQVSLCAWFLWGPSFRNLVDNSSWLTTGETQAALQAPLSVFIALRKTGRARTSDSASGEGSDDYIRRRQASAHREAEDRYFLNRAKRLEARLTDRAPQAEPLVFSVKTGQEFLDALAVASRHGGISNVVVYGHSGPDGLYMLENAGFYADLDDISAEASQEGTSATAKERRDAGARDVDDLVRMIRSGDIVLSSDAMFLLAGCSAAGRTRLVTTSIASELARATKRRVVASVGQTLGWEAFGGPEHGEYSLVHWTELQAGKPATRYGGRGLDPLTSLNFLSVAPPNALGSNPDLLAPEVRATIRDHSLSASLLPGE